MYYYLNEIEFARKRTLSRQAYYFFVRYERTGNDGVFTHLDETVRLQDGVAGTRARGVHPVAPDGLDVRPLVDLEPFVGVLEPREHAQPPEVRRYRPAGNGTQHKTWPPARDFYRNGKHTTALTRRSRSNRRTAGRV